MRNSKSLEEVISNGIEVHALAAELYNKLQSRTDDPRVQLLLEDMTRHDLRMKKVLGQFLVRVEPRILGTYLKHTLEKRPAALIDSVTPSGDNLTIQDIGAMGQQIHIYLTELFEHAQRGCASESCSDLLGHLLQLERAEYRTFSRAVLSTREF